MTTDVTTDRLASRSARIGARVLAVLLATAAPLVVWLVATLVGIPLRVTTPTVGTLSIDAILVILSALPLALAAWGVLALLERFTANARRTWTIVAVVVLALSLPPLLFLDATVATKVVLAIMHVVTGLALILMLRRTAPAAARRPAATR